MKIFKTLIIISLILPINCLGNCCGRSDSGGLYHPTYSEADSKWAKDLARSGRVLVWNDLQDRWKQHEANTGFVTNDADAQYQEKESGLYIFVSSSMSKPLLQSYLREAYQYNGTLVFKGLPQGSFVEFNKFIMDLIGDDKHLAEEAVIQIDDEAFENYSVKQVPTMVLVKVDQDSWVNGEDKAAQYDKTSGNVGIKYSLEQFSDSGLLAEIASDYLKDAKKIGAR